MVAAVAKLGLEGVIAKRRDSKYEAGERSGAWVKLKLNPEQEFVVGGYKRGSPLESLVVGHYEGKKLMCAGKVRQGLNPRNRRELAALLKPYLSDVCPFANLPNSKKSHWGEGITPEQMKEIQWVQPNVIVQVSFTEWTPRGNLRLGTYAPRQRRSKTTGTKTTSPFRKIATVRLPIHNFDTGRAERLRRKIFLQPLARHGVVDTPEERGFFPGNYLWNVI